MIFRHSPVQTAFRPPDSRACPLKFTMFPPNDAAPTLRNRLRKGQNLAP